jgi:DNA-binding NarL/FixJ family response regulator
MSIVRVTGLCKVYDGRPVVADVALALVGRPKVVVFEELTTALDPRARREMPDGSGADASAELVGNGLHSRVLVLTTYDSDADVIPAIEAGATGYILKDAPRDEFFNAVRAVSEDRTVLSPSVAARLMSRVRTPAGPDERPLSTRERTVLDRVASRRTSRTCTPSSASTTAPQRSRSRTSAES